MGELLGLQWHDLDLHEGVLHARRQWTRLREYAPPKTKAALRRIPLSAEMTKELAALKLRSRYSGDSDPVFAARTGRPLGHRNATRRGFEAAAARAGIEGVTFHSMRHAFASRMISRGIDSTVLAALMGHESSTITERRYVHLFDQQRTDEQVRRAMSVWSSSSPAPESNMSASSIPIGGGDRLADAAGVAVNRDVIVAADAD